MRNSQQVILASAARTATSNTQFTQSGIGGKIIIDCTVDPAAASVVFKVQAIDPASGKKIDLLESAAVAGVSTVVLTVHPFITAAANTAANDFLPENVNLLATHADGDSITYSVGFLGLDHV